MEGKEEMEDQVGRSWEEGEEGCGEGYEVGGGEEGGEGAEEAGKDGD